MQNKYCSECGHKVVAYERFCTNCGTQIDASHGNSERSVKPGNFIYKEKDSFNSIGFIFTNLPAMAATLSCDVEDIRSELENYAEELQQIGHRYIIIDACDNEYNNLSPDDSWEDHVDLLKNTIADGSSCPMVFIIGGNEVIPMPCIVNEPAVYADDSEIYSDLPYSYLETTDFSELMWNGQLMCCNVKCHVGRFPTGENMTFNDLSNYLCKAKNALVNNHIKFTKCFGISALSWKITSEAVISKIDRITDLNLSPTINQDNIDDVFQTQSDAYFFNLHGSDSPGNACYFGDDGKSNPRAIFPHNLATAENPNFLMTEACYGGRYIGYDKDDSMLLTSISHNTLSFLGSNVVAFGNPGTSKDLLGADILVSEYINSIIDGYSAGESLSRSRVKTYDHTGNEDLNYALTTILEFSLYGDPIIMTKNGLGKLRSKSKVPTAYLKKIKSMAAPKSVGVLSEVRSLVDQEVEKISKMVNDHMYSRFDIEPRHLSKVYEISGKSGARSYNFVYLKNKNKYPGFYSVFTDTRGKITKIYSSK
jgi:hypothetical protein